MESTIGLGDPNIAESIYFKLRIKAIQFLQHGLELFIVALVKNGFVTFPLLDQQFISQTHFLNPLLFHVLIPYVKICVQSIVSVIISHSSEVMRLNWPLLMLLTSQVIEIILRLRISNMTLILSYKPLQRSLSTKNLLATLSAKLYLKFQTKFQKSVWSPRSKHLGQNLSISIPYWIINVLSLLASPYLLVRWWLLLKWLTLCPGLIFPKSISHVCVVHFKSKNLEQTSQFQNHPFSPKVFLNQQYPPFTMQTFWLQPHPFLFFQVFISIFYYFDSSYYSYQPLSTSTQSPFFILDFFDRFTVGKGFDLYFRLLSCSLVKWLNFTLPLSLPLLSKSLENAYSTSFDFIGMMGSTFLPFKKLKQSYRRFSIWQSEIIWFLKYILIILFYVILDLMLTLFLATNIFLERGRRDFSIFFFYCRSGVSIISRLFLRMIQFLLALSLRPLISPLNSVSSIASIFSILL